VLTLDFMAFVCLIFGRDNCESSNDLSYNGRFAYDGSPNVIFPNLSRRTDITRIVEGEATLGKLSLDELTFSHFLRFHGRFF